MSKQVCIISHTEHSCAIEKTNSLGEVNNSKKLRQALKEQGLSVTEIFDFYALCGIAPEEPEKKVELAKLIRMNIELAGIDEPLIDDFGHDFSATFQSGLQKQLSSDKENVILLLTWMINVYASLGMGLLHKHPLITKCYCWHLGEREHSNFPVKAAYDRSQLLICESPLAAIEHMKEGVPPWKFLFLPNTAPEFARTLYGRSEEEKRDDKKAYLQAVAKENQKEIDVENSLIIGYPARFLRGKNVEYLPIIMHELHTQFPHVKLLLKGDYSPAWDQGSGYTEKLQKVMAHFQEEPWFLWDRSHSSFEDALKMYACIDLCPYLSGAEIGSNTLVELCALGVPCLTPHCTVYPYLYKGMVEMFKAGELTESIQPFYQPDIDDLKRTLVEWIQAPEKRKNLGARAHHAAFEKFSEACLKERLEWMVDAASSYYHHDSKENYWQKKLEAVLYEDIKRYAEE